MILWYVSRDMYILLKDVVVIRVVSYTCHQICTIRAYNIYFIYGCQRVIYIYDVIIWYCYMCCTLCALSIFWVFFFQIWVFFFRFRFSDSHIFDYRYQILLISDFPSDSHILFKVSNIFLVSFQYFFTRFDTKVVALNRVWITHILIFVDSQTEILLLI